MATAALGRAPTCITCLRRITSLPSLTSSPLSLVQTRGKRNTSRRKYDGVVVRLLEDIPRFGRKNAVLRVARGRMRNEWFANKKAEYMTLARFADLGLARTAVEERDPAFAAQPAADLAPASAPAASLDLDGLGEEAAAVAADEDELEFNAIGEGAMARQEKPYFMPIEPVSPGRSWTLLDTLVPETLTFIRQANPARSSSPSSSATPPPPSSSAPSSSPDASAAIFGSVTTTDIANSIRALLAADPEASRVHIEPRNIRFVDLGEGADRVKSRGRWTVEIMLAPPSHRRRGSLDPVRKTVEVVAAEPGQGGQT